MRRTETSTAAITTATACVYRIGDWHFDPDLHRVEREMGPEAPIRLEPKVSGLLRCLAERAGRPVSKDEIFAQVWDQSFLADSALTRVVADLRRVLGDDARDPTYVETVSKVGYRLLCEVQVVPIEPGPTLEVAPSSPVDSRLRPRPAGVRLPALTARLAAIVAGAALLGALAGLVGDTSLRAESTNGPTRDVPTQASTESVPVVVVLPLRDLTARTGAPQPALFAEGTTQELVVQLARHGVSVVSRHTVDQWSADGGPLLPVARELGVEAVLDGQVQRDGDLVRVSLQLTEVDGGTYAWAQSYSRTMDDELSLQADLAQTVVRDLLPFLGARLDPS